MKNLLQKYFVVCALILPFAGAVNSEEMLMVGQGATLCSVFNADIDNEPQKAVVYLAWGHGYMSAINARNTLDSANVDLSSNYDQQMQIDILRTYCAENPKKLMVFGVMELMKMLE